MEALPCWMEKNIICSTCINIRFAFGLGTRLPSRLRGFAHGPTRTELAFAYSQSSLGMGDLAHKAQSIYLLSAAVNHISTSLLLSLSARDISLHICDDDMT